MAVIASRAPVPALTNPVSTFALGSALVLLFLFLENQSRRTSWCGCTVNGVPPWLRVAAISLLTLGLLETVLDIIVLTGTISPRSLNNVLAFSSLVMSKAVQTFAHVLLIYVCVQLRGGGRRVIGFGVVLACLSSGEAAMGCLAGLQLFFQRSPDRQGVVEGTVSLGVALIVNAAICAVLLASPQMRLPGLVLVLVALIQAAGISFWVTGNQWTTFFVLPLANIYIVTVLLSLQRNIKTYTIRSGLCTHAVREIGSRTSFVFASSPAASIIENYGSRDKLTANSMNTISSRWSRDTTDVGAKRRLFIKKAKPRDGVVAAGPPPLLPPKSLPPVSQLIRSRDPVPQDPFAPRPAPASAEPAFTSSASLPSVPAPYLVPSGYPAPSHSFVESRPYPAYPSALGNHPHAPYLSASAGATSLRSLPPSRSPLPFNNLYPKPLLSNNMTITTDMAAEMLGRMMMDADSQSGTNEARDEFIVAPQRLTNPYSPVPPPSPPGSTSTYPASPLTRSNLSYQEKQLKDAIEKVGQGSFRPASTVTSEQGSAIDPELDVVVPQVAPLNLRRKRSGTTSRLYTLAEE